MDQSNVKVFLLSIAQCAMLSKKTFTLL